MPTTSQAVEQKALVLPNEARTLGRIIDQRTFELAAGKLRDVVTVRNEIRAYHAPLKQAAHAAHQAICDAETKMLAPVAEAERIYKGYIAEYERAQLIVQEEARRKAKAEAEAVAEAERQRKLEEVEADTNRMLDQLAGEAMSVEELEAIEAERENVVTAAVEDARAEPLPPVRYEMEPVIYKARGVSTVITHEAEVTNIKDLCRAVAEGQVPAEYVMANLPALNRVVKVLWKTFSVPGVKVVERSGVRAQGR